MPRSLSRVCGIHSPTGRLLPSRIGIAKAEDPRFRLRNRNWIRIIIARRALNGFKKSFSKIMQFAASQESVVPLEFRILSRLYPSTDSWKKPRQLPSIRRDRPSSNLPKSPASMYLPFVRPMSLKWLKCLVSRQLFPSCNRNFTRQFLSTVRRLTCGIHGCWPTACVERVASVP